MCRSRNFVTKKNKRGDKMATYTEKGRTVEVEQVANLSKAEVRMFFYFLTRKAGCFSEKKQRKFKAYFELGTMPEEMGMITKKGNQAFCIRETHPGYYTLYMSKNEECALCCWIKKIVAEVKK